MKHDVMLCRRMRQQICRWLVPSVAVGLLVGCATLNQEPFIQYHNAVREAQAGIDAAMSVNYSWTRSGFIHSFSSDTNSRFSRLMIQPGADYDWSLPESPVYLQVKRARSGLAGLNEGFADYAGLLAKLAARELVSTATFDQMAKDLNRNASDALKTLDPGVPPEGIALFSTAASKAARMFIENRRQHHLKEAIEKNQTNVTRYSELCVSLIHTIRGNIKAYYDDRTESIQDAWNSTTGDKRKKNTEAMMNLNEQYADAMSVLQELEAAYSALPAAHTDLAQALAKPSFNAEGIQTLYSSAKRLQQLYKTLQKTSAKESE